MSGYPDFDPDDVDIWFLCLEVAFELNEVNTDNVKFNIVIVLLGKRAKYMRKVIMICNKNQVIVVAKSNESLAVKRDTSRNFSECMASLEDQI
uniref:DUF7041 domain-containing protein n=1 Tax=Anopheles minimus TaxID=112268 RepID=A0A182VWM2_9DIPT